MSFTLLLSSLALCCFVCAQEGHQRFVVPEGADWATRHMIEEHHIQEFDAGSFFTLHDYDSTNEWTASDIIKTLGLLHESNNHVGESEKDSAAKRVIDMFDSDRNGAISFTEYVDGVARGVKLPDLGYGPGHHGDDEYEYEIHHWELYHDENTKEEDLTHPEDIEHFRKHELLEEQQEKQEQMDQIPIIESNIPSKFLRRI